MNKTPEKSPCSQNQHGTTIALDQVYPALAEAPLQINGIVRDKTSSDNPDRFKQHGFHFNADNCIACHACESACSEKNNLEPHLAYRRVGTIEGGTYPDVTRINISMACNHCDDPVCLKGCPTRAYTKYLEYGAVLQDPDICFGCGYCTWVCPYNAPQLDTEQGHVEKCNMCVDRLEVGLQPACVSACLGNALEFGVIEDLPATQEDLSLTIPSFPDPSISKPNIRFQLKSDLPNSFGRLDDVPIRYERPDTAQDPLAENPAGPEGFEGKETETSDDVQSWNLNKLRSREDPLVLFTLISQSVVAAFLMLFPFPYLNDTAAVLMQSEKQPLAMAAILGLLIALQSFALIKSTLHLGKPQFFYRAMNNLRHSWVSREIATMGGFFGLFSAYGVVTTFPGLIAWLPESLIPLIPLALGCSAATLGPLGIYCMYRCYRIKARPYWDHWHSGAAFLCSGLILGSAVLGTLFGFVGLAEDQAIAPLMLLFSLLLVGALILQGASFFFHRKSMVERGEEAAVSRMLMRGVHGKVDQARLMSWAFLLLSAVFFSVSPPDNLISMLLWAGFFGLSVLHELVGRALFYVLVVPTTVPRAFFWGNASFEESARHSGLADKPQVGVLRDVH